MNDETEFLKAWKEYVKTRRKSNTERSTDLLKPVGIMQNPGLTKREYFAAMAMQGILSRSVTLTKDDLSTAVKAADALIEELNEERS